MGGDSRFVRDYGAAAAGAMVDNLGLSRAAGRLGSLFLRVVVRMVVLMLGGFGE